MGLSDIAGVFSRYFIVGFFLPLFFTIVVLAQVVDAAFLPHVYVQASSGARIAILGGAALAGGLLLLGVHYNVIRFYEGYPLAAAGAVPVVKYVNQSLLYVQRVRFRRARRRCDDTHLDEQGPFEAAWRLGRRFPYDRKTPDAEAMLLPTAFGNVVRAFEWRSFVNWHLNSIGAWPHIENLLSDHEAQVLADAKGDVAFFLNSSLLATAGGIVLVVDLLQYQRTSALLWLFVPLVIALVAYRAAIGAAEGWGDVVCACIDLHRRELFDKLGLRAPVDFRDERVIAWNLNRTLILGQHLPDELAAAPRHSQDTAAASGDGGGGSPAAAEPSRPGDRATQLEQPKTRWMSVLVDKLLKRPG